MPSSKRQLEMIRAALARGEAKTVIAHRHKLSARQVWNIAAGRCWGEGMRKPGRPKKPLVPLRRQRMAQQFTRPG